MSSAQKPAWRAFANIVYVPLGIQHGLAKIGTVVQIGDNDRSFVFRPQVRDTAAALAWAFDRIPGEAKKTDRSG